MNTSTHSITTIGIKACRVFIFTAGVLLLTTALAKVISACGIARVLQLEDPVFLVSYKTLFWTVGLFELLVATICFIGNHTLLQLCLIAWLATSLAIYRLALIFIGYEKPCPCLGSLTSAIHLSTRTSELILVLILIYLLVGSYVGLCLHCWRRIFAPPSVK
jgi:hypothetical protein